MRIFIDPDAAVDTERIVQMRSGIALIWPTQKQSP
jgi:hypothetical protein